MIAKDQSEPGAIDSPGGTSVPEESTPEATRTRAAAEWTARAEQYAAYAVPKNRPFARRLVELACPRPGDRVLDVATGPGVVAIEAGRAMGGRGEVLATDLSPTWAPFVAAAAAEAGLGNIAFAATPAEALALPDATFDVAFCQFGLMFVAEPAAALREMHRVLKPGGTVAVAVWSTPDKVAHFAALRALQAHLPPPPDPAPSPMSLGAPGLIERLVADAGFRNLSVERVTAVYEAADPADEWRRLRDDDRFAAPLAALSNAARAAAHEAVLAALEPFRQGAVLRLPSEAILVVATR